ncbi:hypothetical protein ACOSQ3_027604 [Xanthoceras sorbifolium]
MNQYGAEKPVMEKAAEIRKIHYWKANENTSAWKTLLSLLFYCGNVYILQGVSSTGKVSFAEESIDMN